jgi:hypothetical protein
MERSRRQSDIQQPTLFLASFEEQGLADPPRAAPPFVAEFRFAKPAQEIRAVAQEEPQISEVRTVNPQGPTFPLQPTDSKPEKATKKLGRLFFSTR